jgi:ribosomal protein S27AE
MNTTPNKSGKSRGFVIPVLIASLALVAVGLIIEATKTPPLKCPKDGAEMFINSGAGVALCPKCGYTYDLSK